MSTSFEHYWYMLSHSGLSNAVNPASPVDWLRTYIKPPDPAKLDGATFYFEIVCTNNTGSDKTITLRSVTGSSDVTTITSPSTDTTSGGTIRRSNAFTYTSGHVLCVRYPSGTYAAGSLLTYAARIVVVQANATKTVIQVPHMACGQQAVGSMTSTNTATGTYSHLTQPASANTYQRQTGTGTANRHGFWNYDSTWFGGLASSNGWRLEVVGALSGSGTGATELYNYTDSQHVTNSRVTGITSTFGVWETTFSSDTYLVTGKDYEIWHTTSSTSRSLYAHRVALWITIDTLGDIECYYLFEGYWNVAITAADGSCRHRINTANFGNAPTFLPEITGFKASGTVTDNVYMCDADTNTSGTTHSSDFTPKIDLPNTTRTRNRESAITNPTSGDYVVREGNASNPTITFANHLWVCRATANAATWSPMDPMGMMGIYGV